MPGLIITILISINIIIIDVLIVINTINDIKTKEKFERQIKDLTDETDSNKGRICRLNIQVNNLENKFNRLLKCLHIEYYERP